MPLLIILLVAGTIIIPALIAKPSFAQIASHKENVVLTPIFVQTNYLEYSSNQLRFQILNALNHSTTNASGSIASLQSLF